MIDTIVKIFRGFLAISDSNGNVVDTVDDAGTRRLAVNVSNVQTSPNDFLSKVSSDDTTGDFLEEKVTAASSKVTVATANPAGDEELQIDIVESNISHSNLADLTADSHPQYLNETRHDSLPFDNPHNVNKTQVGLGSVPNVDATDRANHVGTQLASTISDFTSAVQAAETTTTLTLAANVLTYTNEDGVVSNFDLSVYLDDTNLARIVNGTLNPTTGIITFTRDDSSTFTIDASALLDDQNASEVPVTPTGNLTSTDVQAALEELQGDVDGLTTADANLQTQITNNDTDISNIQTEQTTQNTNISTLQTDVTNLQASQTTQDAAIALNTAKVSADGSIDTHSDVDTTTVPAVVDDLLGWDGTNWVPKSIDNGFTIFPIWAEENAGLANGSNEWSFGNGATGAIGIPLALDCELFAISLNADTFGTSVSVNIQQNGTTVSTPNFTTNNEVVLITSIDYSLGDLLSFQTNTVVGGFTNARVCAWFRVRSTALFPTPDRSVVQNSSIGFSSSTFTDIPGMTTTVSLTDTGDIDGVFYYSALRSGALNAVTEYRVVINGNNGQSYIDTLSTFNDTGAVAHNVSGLSPGTYTVTAQGLTDQPITITSCQLVAVAVET